MILIGSSKIYSEKIHKIIYSKIVSDNTLIKVDIPKIPATFTGSGDLFAALFLAHLHLQSNMKAAIEKTVNSLHSVLLNTYEYSLSKGKVYFTYKRS